MRDMTVENFRLLDLPPELRNRVYHCLFEDIAPHTLDVLDAASFLPDGGVTTLSHRMRHETFPIFEDARRCFWQNHIPLITVENVKTKACQTDDQVNRSSTDVPAIFRACKALQNEHIMQTLVHVEFPDGQDVGVKITAKEGGLVGIHADCPVAGVYKTFVEDVFRTLYDQCLDRVSVSERTGKVKGGLNMMFTGEIACRSVGCKFVA